MQIPHEITSSWSSDTSRHGQLKAFSHPGSCPSIFPVLIKRSKSTLCLALNPHLFQSPSFPTVRIPGTLAQSSRLRTLSVTCESSGVSTVISMTVGRTVKSTYQKVENKWLARKCEKIKQTGFFFFFFFLNRFWMFAKFVNIFSFFESIVCSVHLFLSFSIETKRKHSNKVNNKRTNSHWIQTFLFLFLLLSFGFVRLRLPSLGSHFASKRPD